MSKKIDRTKFPHKYVGPTTPYGLRTGSPCKITGKRAGGKTIRTENGRSWLVAGSTVVKA